MTESKIKEEINDKINFINFRNKEKVDSSFLLIVENKNNKLIALSASIDSEGDISLYGITKGEYKSIRSVKKEALIDNNKIKAIYGNSKAANDMKVLISKELDKAQTIEVAKNIQSGVSENAGRDIDDVVLEKMTQKIEERILAISEENMSKINNQASLLYKSNNGYKFVSVKKEGDKYFIEKTNEYLVKEDILRNPNIKGIYGGSDLALSLKKLFKNIKNTVAITSKEETESTVDEIKDFLKEKGNNKNKIRKPKNN